MLLQELNKVLVGRMPVDKLRVWVPVWKSFGNRYDITQDLHITQDYVFIISLVFEKILSGFQFRIQAGWSPLKRSDSKKYGISLISQRLINLRAYTSPAHAPDHTVYDT